VKNHFRLWMNLCFKSTIFHTIFMIHYVCSSILNLQLQKTGNRFSLTTFMVIFGHFGGQNKPLSSYAFETRLRQKGFLFYLFFSRAVPYRWPDFGWLVKSFIFPLFFMVPWSPDRGQVTSSGHLRGQPEKHMVKRVKQKQKAVVVVLKC